MRKILLATIAAVALSSPVLARGPSGSSAVASSGGSSTSTIESGKFGFAAGATGAFTSTGSVAGRGGAATSTTTASGAIGKTSNGFIGSTTNGGGFAKANSYGGWGGR